MTAEDFVKNHYPQAQWRGYIKMDGEHGVFVQDRPCVDPKGHEISYNIVLPEGEDSFEPYIDKAWESAKLKIKTTNHG